MENVNLLINSMAAGGAERVLSIIAGELINENIKVTIICIEKDDFYKLPNGVRIWYLLKSSGHGNALCKIFDLLYCIWKLRRIINNQQIRTLQSHLFKSNYINILTKIAGAGHRAQIVNTVAVSSKYSKKNIKGVLNLLLIKYLYPFADHIIYKSTAMANDFKKKYNFKNRQTVINNPYDFKMIKTLSSQRYAENVPVDSNTIISVGRFEAHKNYSMLVQTFALLSRENKKINLLIIGDGPEKTKIEQMVKVMNINEKVSLPGRLKNPFILLKKAGVYVSCSESEGFPNALIEALACGLPVVSSDCLSGPREILAPDTDPDQRLERGYECARYGILFAVKDAEALAEALKKILSDNELNKKYIMKTGEALKRYSIDSIVKEYKAVLGITVR